MAIQQFDLLKKSAVTQIQSDLENAVEADRLLAQQAAVDSVDAKELSQEAQGLSEDARDKSEQWAENPEDMEVEPGKYSALHHAAKAEDLKDLAEKWAEENEDVEVETGRYSAKHWATKADETVTGKEETANKQNSLAVDGTGAKYPTVDAVKTNLDKVLAIALLGDEGNTNTEKELSVTKHNDTTDRDSQDAHPLDSITGLKNSLIMSSPISLVRTLTSGSSLGVFATGGIGNLQLKINEEEWVEAESHKDGTEYYYKFTNVPEFYSIYAKDELEQEVFIYSNQDFGKVVYRDELWTVVYDDNKLKRSPDDGVTFDKELSVSSIPELQITAIYVFENGDLLIFRPNSCMYSKDWINLSTSIIKDESGEIWDNEANGYPRFRQFLSAKKHRPIIEHEGNDIEVLMFSTYATPTNLWYTIDNGVTIKCAYRFRNIRTGIYPANPGAGVDNITILHVHSVDFNPSDSSHYVQTGDHRIWDAERDEYTNECNVIKFTYNPATDTFSHSVIGNGFEFKWCNAIFDVDTVYWSWDYNPNGGVMKSLISGLADIANHVRVLDIENDCICIVANSQEMMATILYPGSPMPNKNFYYTENYKASEPVWHLIKGEIPLPEYDYPSCGWWNLSQPIEGKIIASFMSLFRQSSPAELMPELQPLLPSTDLVGFIRKQGFVNAFNS